MKLDPQDINIDPEDSNPDLFYNESSGKLEKRSTMNTFQESNEPKASEDDLLNKALDRLNKGLSGDLLADEEDHELMF